MKTARRFRWNRTKLLVSVLMIGALGAFVLTLFHTSNKELTDSIRHLRRTGQFDQASLVAEELAARHPSDVDSWKLIADVAEAADSDERLAEALHSLISLDPNRAADYWLRLASLEMSRNDASAATFAIDHALAVNPDSAAAYRLKSQLTSVLGRTQELTQSLLQLIRLKSFTVDDLIILASSDPFVLDEVRLAALAKSHPADARLSLPLARSAVNDNRVPEARELLNKLLTQNPEDWEAQAILGQILADIGDAEFLQWQTKLPPTADLSSRIWMVRGLWLEKKGETRSAARCFHEAILLEPELVVAVSHLSQCLKLNGEHGIAQMYSQRAQLLVKVRDLATRIDNQKNLQWAPELIGSLEALGQLWEAWGWSTLLLKSDPLNPQVKDYVRRLQKKLVANMPRTNPAAYPAQQLDWTQVSLPEWTKFSATAKSDLNTAAVSGIRFQDDAAAAGVNFVYQSKSPREESGNLIFESTGGGVAVVDYDCDGWPDLFFVQGGDVHKPPASLSGDAILRNHRGENFSDESSIADVSDTAYGQGVSAGDVDNDGFPDLYIANIGANRLLLNNGDGTFTDSSSAAFQTPPRWTISTAIADLNRDGLPELIDVNYCEGQEPLTTVCVTEEQKPRACRPTIFQPAPDIHLFSNGDGTFIASDLLTDASAPGGRGMGVVVGDFDGNHSTDIFVANDQSPNHLLLNNAGPANQAASFTEQGLVRGVGLDREGFALAFMGVAHGDVNRDGQPDFFVTTFSQETPTLFLSQPGGQFTDSTREADLRAPCFGMLGFGTQFLDADNDGQLDLLILNGHIDQFTESGQQYRMRPQCFRGLPGSRFQELPEEVAGSFFNQPRLGRALALLDWNRDGKIDFVASDLEDPVALGSNASTSTGHALNVRCIGVRGSRDTVGTQISVMAGQSLPWITQVTAGDGYEVSNERCVHIGIGSAAWCDTVTIDWTAGLQAQFSNVSCEVSWLAVEGRTVLYSCPK